MSYLYCNNNYSSWPIGVTPCPNVIYAATAGTTIPVVSGGTEIALPIFIPNGVVTVPDNTVTLITPLLNLTSTRGGITVNNGFFTVPLDGQYLVTAVACFSNTGITPTEGDYVALYLYKVDNYSQPQGLVTLVAQVTAVPIPPGQVGHTCVNLSYIVDLRANDRIFLGATQLTQRGTLQTLELSANTRIAITRLC